MESEMKGIKNKVEMLFYFGLLLLFGFLISLLSPLNPFSNVAPDVDSSVFLYIGESMAKYGQLPYRDVFDHKGPLLYFINAMGIKINGAVGVWYIEFFLMVINLLLLYVIAKIITKNKLTAFVTAVLVTLPLVKYFEGGNLTEEYAMPFMLVSLYFFVKYIFSSSDYLPKLHVLLIGASCGSVLLLRPNMIALWISFCFIIFVYFLIQRKFFNLIQSAVLFILGNLLIIIPFAAYYYYHSALDDLVNGYLVFNFGYTDSNGGIETLWNTMLYFWDTSALIGISFLFSIVGIVKKRDIKSLLLYGSSGLFLLTSLVLLSISGRVYFHYGMVLIPCFVIPIALFIMLINDQIKGSYYIPKVVFNFALVVLLGISTIMLAKDKIIFVNTAPPDLVNEKVVSYIQDHTQKDDRITVVGNKVSYFLLSDRRSASKYLYQAPIADISSQILHEYLQDIKTKKPKLIIYPIPSYKGGYGEIVLEYLNTLVEQGEYRLNDKIVQNVLIYEKNS
ncbi:ArnT family glycosyltransferase [Neobacillus mesonae]|uniref:Glycosyltransferase RgtA/B/C/D-like domain-containing protein n=1 Tax=Neobacillus mesonae TaxID=1193713 RepID=A0A3Q9QZ59_9BACI|nr:hypothetical protein [Neobacillus mesonae]AZU63995.1 hypothetical protein CHR53_23580 [Neobacillus mesonae]